jgi:dolichol-phosphate mannosyltransferase
VPYVFQERERGASKLGARQYVEYLQHLVRLAVGTGQFLGWIRYGLVALAGAFIDVILFVTLVRRCAWPPVAALPLAIETALLSNFVCSETITFRSTETPAFGRGFMGRLAQYERVCIPGAIFNIMVTLAWIWHRGGITTAASAGVVAGGAINLLLNIPAIWRTWAGRPPGVPLSPQA